MSIVKVALGWLKIVQNKSLLNYPQTLGISLIGLPTANLVYLMTTRNSDTVEVKSKYQDVQHGHTHYQFTGTNDKIYNIPHSVWMWQWDVQEKWTRLNPGSKYNIHYWGVRIPALGLFPRVYRVSEVVESGM
jgi:hypothetical protein